MAVFGLSVDSCIDAKYGESLKGVKDESFKKDLLQDIKDSANKFIEAKLAKIEALYNNIESSIKNLTTAGSAAAGTFASMSTLMPSGTSSAVAVATSTKAGFEATLDSMSSDMALMEESLSELGVMKIPSVASGIGSIKGSVDTVSTLIKAIPVS